MFERPKPSMVLLTLVRGSVVLVLECCKSRENWARKWLISRQENVLVKDSAPVSVATCSSPFSLIALVVSGLDGSRKTLFSPE